MIGTPLLSTLFAFLYCFQQEPESQAFIEWATAKESCYVNESVPVTLRLGIAREFLDDKLIPFSRQELDIPIHVRAASLIEHEGASIVPRQDDEGGASPSGSTLALNDRVARVRRMPDREFLGVAFAVFELETGFVFSQPGTQALQPPSMNLVYATRFENDFLNGRVPLDRHPVEIKGEEGRITVRDLPDTGRPESFSGAVGQLGLRAQADFTRLESESLIAFTLQIQGQGSTNPFELPSLAAGAAFHVLGRLDDTDAGARHIRYELKRLSAEARAIPAVEFSYFDPVAARYRRLRTPSIPLPLAGEERTVEVTASEIDPTSSESSATTGTGPAVADTAPGESIESASKANPDGLRGLRRSARIDRSSPLSAGWSSCVLALPWLLAAGLWAVLRRRELDRRDPYRARARRAAANFRRHIAKANEPHWQGLFAEYLAARLRCPDPAVIDPELSERFTRAGISSELSQRAVRHLETLTAQQYGRPVTPELGRKTPELVEQLELEFKQTGGQLA